MKETLNPERQVCIIGAGAAGLMASIFSAQAGSETIVLETNSTPARKLLLTGGGRCNITHQAEPSQLIKSINNGGKFLRYCIYRFSPQQVQDFFAESGLQTIIEPDGCVFPLSNKASDVKNALLKKATALGVKFLYSSRVSDAIKEAGVFIISAGATKVISQRLIIATGGLSWPQTGCTGDGFRFASLFGHSIIQPKASLVPLVMANDWPIQVEGTAVENVSICTRTGNKNIVATGSLIFTSDGIGGSAAQELSRHITDYLSEQAKPVPVKLDLLPNITADELESYVIKYIGEHPKKMVDNILADFLPKRLTGLLCKLAGCTSQLPSAHLEKRLRKKLIELVKSLPGSILRTRPIREAVVTRGGICLDEIDEKTMQSRLCPGLFFAGEVMDADGPCGGYNLQICWSTGALAGVSAAAGYNFLNEK
jgi:predicted Rossmann fold flavoprotein